MRLLIYTQAVDTEDPILGFFHGWLLEFAKHFAHIDVICLKEGKHSLPENVRVYSLGKEKGGNWLQYIIRFYKYLFQLQGSYDKVFVHMNPHYVLLGGLYWKVKGIPIFFWRNHARMNLMTRIAAPLAKRVFYTSPFACTSRYAHAVQMPVGIDYTRFRHLPKEDSSNKKYKVLFLGRVSPVKRIELFVDAGRHLGEEYELHLYGDDPQKDQSYLTMLKERAPQNVFFHPAVKNEDTPSIYCAHDIYVNLTPKGSMDKTVLEAVGCEIPVLVTNASFLDVLTPFEVIEDVTPESLAEKIIATRNLSSDERESHIRSARKKSLELHSLKQLGIMLYTYMV